MESMFNFSMWNNSNEITLQENGPYILSDLVNDMNSTDFLKRKYNLSQMRTDYLYEHTFRPPFPPLLLPILWEKIFATCLFAHDIPLIYYTAYEYTYRYMRKSVMW